MTVSGRPAGVARALLLVAALAVAIEASFFIGWAVLDLLDLSSERLGLGIGTAVFLAAYGLGQLIASRGLLRGSSWARGPLVMTQIIQLLLAWSYRDVAAVPVIVAMVAGAVVALACMLAPPVTQALGADDRV